MGTGGPRPTRIPPAGHTHSERRLSRTSYAIKEYVIGICQFVKTADNWYYIPVSVIYFLMNHNVPQPLTSALDKRENACLAHSGLTTI